MARWCPEHSGVTIKGPKEDYYQYLTGSEMARPKEQRCRPSMERKKGYPRGWSFLYPTEEELDRLKAYRFSQQTEHPMGLNCSG